MGHGANAKEAVYMSLAERLNKNPVGTPIRDDLSSADRIAEIIAGADAVVSAFGPPKDDPRFFSDVSYTDQLLNVTEREIAAVRTVSRLGLPPGLADVRLQLNRQADERAE